MKRFTPYDIENVNTLLMSGKPFAISLAYLFKRNSDNKIDYYREMTRVLIELETSKESVEKQLIEYKMRYGEIK